MVLKAQIKTKKAKAPEFCFIYSTFPDLKEAEKISEILLTKKLIACANIFPKGKSLYMWEGKLEKSEESFVIFKTSEGLYKEICKELKKIHTYETPCILKIKIDTSNPEYGEWLNSIIKKS